jgi:hypothetical protein
MAALRPDLIVVQGSAETSQRVEEFARERAIRTDYFSIESVRDVLSTLARLGVLTGMVTRAAA